MPGPNKGASLKNEKVEIIKNMFCIVDVQTTGLEAQGEDRMIELALVKLDDGLRVVKAIDTLIHPGFDIGSRVIDGIRASHLSQAPDFPEIMPGILNLMNDSVIVGQDVNFFMRFFTAALVRNSIRLADFKTLDIFQEAVKISEDYAVRSLDSLAELTRVETKRRRGSLGRANTVADIFRALASKNKEHYLGLGPIDYGFPDLPMTGEYYPRSAANLSVEFAPNYLEYLIGKLPSKPAGELEVNRYIHFVDRCLSDGTVQSDEFQALLDFASECGLSKQQALNAHLTYLDNLIKEAWRDRILSEKEIRQLNFVRDLFQIEPDIFQMMIEQHRPEEHSVTAE